MTITNGYLTLAELQAALSRSVNTSDYIDPETDRIEQCITSASRIVDLWSEQRFYEYSVTSENFDIYAVSENGFRVSETGFSIYAPRIRSVKSLTIDGVSCTEGIDFSVYGSRYGLSKIVTDKNLTLRRKGTSADGVTYGVVISADLGWSTVPDDIKEATIMIAKSLSGLAISARTDEIGQIQQIIRSEVPRWVMQICRQYRRNV